MVKNNTSPLLSDQLSGTNDTSPLLKVATHQNSQWEEEASSKNTRSAEVIFYVSSTVGTGMPGEG